MKTFVLIGVVDYESDEVLGVYSSNEKAEEAKQKNARFRSDEERFPYDRYRIEERVLDA